MPKKSTVSDSSTSNEEAKSDKLRRYRVSQTFKSTVVFVVEAKDEEEARRKADNATGAADIFAQAMLDDDDVRETEQEVDL
jgi:hypothetical protein